VRRKNEFALHPLDDRRYRLAALIPISIAAPNTSYSPIRIQTRLGRLSLHDDTDESFTVRASLLDRLGESTWYAISISVTYSHPGKLRISWSAIRSNSCLATSVLVTARVP
jgi:hypothetical protein